VRYDERAPEADAEGENGDQVPDYDAAAEAVVGE
jgi:hypothetical protein